MRTIPAGECKAKCLAIMDEVQARGESIIVTKFGKPVVRVTPLESVLEPESPPVFNGMRGMAVIVGDIVESPYSDAEWEGFEERRTSIVSDEAPE